MTENVIKDPHGKGGALARGLILVSGICLMAGLITPMLETRRLVFFSEAHSLVDVTRSLLEADQYLLGFVILIFSILFPIAKTIYLMAINLGVAHGNVALIWADRLGKWSMLDVMVAGLIVFTLSGNQALHIFEQPGLYFFTLAIIGLMLASGLMGRVR